MRGLNPSVARRARSRTVLEGWKVVDDGRKTNENGNFAAVTSKLTAKKRKGGNFMEKSSKRATFSKEISSSDFKAIGITDSSTEDRDASSSESGSEGGLKPSEEAEQSLVAEESSSSSSSSEQSSSAEDSSSSSEQSLAAEDSSAAEPESSSSESSSEDSEEAESEERSDKEAEMEREPAYTVIELSSGDEDPLPSKKIYCGPSSRTRSKNPTKTPKIHVAESSRKRIREPSYVSKQKNKKKKTENLVQPWNLQRKRKRSKIPAAAAEETSRRRDAAESSKKTKEKKAKGRQGDNLRWSDDRVAEDVHNSDMLSCTGRSEEVQGEVVSDNAEDIALKNEVVEEARKRKDRLRSAVKSNRQFSQLLTNLLWQEEDEIAKLMQPEPRKVRKVLPRFFNYWETDEPKKVEKTEEEKEMDALWTQMDVLLMNDRNGSSQACDEEEVVGAGKCPKGKHRLVLKEEIGLVCSICSHVETEITAMDPSSFEKAVPSKRRDNDYRRPLDDLHMNGDDEDDDSEKGSSGEQFAETGTVWDLVPRYIRRELFPHQKEGFEFMWKNVGGSINLEELSSSSAEEVGGGCIISHAPGTGKTRLTLVFLKAYTQLYPKSCPIVIAPASMLRTWEEEFDKCEIDIPFHNLSSDEFSMKEKHELLKLVDENIHLKNKKSIRLVKLYSWSKTTSVLGISYSLFVKLVGSSLVKLLEMPGVVVLDEGHYPRNDESNVWNTLCKMKTKKRIILSGTPFQNNCDELQNTFKLIRPREERPVAAKLDNLKRTEDSDRRAEILKTAVIPYAHVYKGSILQDNLRGLRSCAILLNPTEYQSKILQILPTSAITLESEHKKALVTIHPSLVLHCKLSQKEEHAIESEKERLVPCRGDPYQGAKTWFLVEFVGLCIAAKEKVLIFSQYKKPLMLIKEQLCAIFKWSVDQDQEVLIMSGDFDQSKRQNMIRRFNDPYSEAVVLLASTKACSEGISLVGASRVILLDVVWNPSVERQAISRAYRLGQKKVVYTYHLMMKGSSEGDRYLKQTKKQRMSEFMFSNSSSGDAVVGPPSSSTLSYEDEILDMMKSRADLKKLFHKVIFQPRENNLMEKFGLVDQP